MHSLLEKAYRDGASPSDLTLAFAKGFQTVVRGERPAPGTVHKYIESGYRYLSGFSRFDGEVLGVEELLRFTVDGFPFVAVVDLRTEANGKLSIIDHKSRELKPRSDRAIPKASDIELDRMLRQLYLYSEAVKQAYGRYPDELCFNCFRNGCVIREPFDASKHKEACDWAVQSIREIECEEDFAPRQNYFFCRWLCPVSDHCDADIAAREERRG